MKRLILFHLVALIFCQICTQFSAHAQKHFSEKYDLMETAMQRPSSTLDRINRYKLEKGLTTAGIGLLVVSGASYIAYHNLYEEYKASTPQDPEIFTQADNWRKVHRVTLYTGAAFGLTALVLWRIKRKKLMPYGMNNKNGKRYMVEVYPTYIPSQSWNGQLHLGVKF